MYGKKILILVSCAVIGFSLPAIARNGDGTGPEGKGPKTGRGAGICAGNSVPGYLNNDVPRRGVNRTTNPRGGGNGQRNGSGR